MFIVQDHRPYVSLQRRDSSVLVVVRFGATAEIAASSGTFITQDKDKLAKPDVWLRAIACNFLHEEVVPPRGVVGPEY